MSLSVLTSLGRIDRHLHDAARSLMTLSTQIEGLTPVSSRPDLPTMNRPVEWVIACDAIEAGAVEQVVHRYRGVLDIRLLQAPSESPGGAAGTRNRALAASTRPLIAALDSSDFVLPGFASLVATMIEYPKVPWAAGLLCTVDEQGRVIWDGPTPPFPYGVVPANCYIEHIRRHGYVPFAHTAAIARRDVLIAEGGYDTSTVFARHGDNALWARVCRRHQGHFEPVHVTAFRKHAASLTHPANDRATGAGFQFVLDRLDVATREAATRLAATANSPGATEVVAA